MIALMWRDVVRHGGRGDDLPRETHSAQGKFCELQPGPSLPAPGVVEMVVASGLVRHDLEPMGRGAAGTSIADNGWSKTFHRAGVPSATGLCTPRNEETLAHHLSISSRSPIRRRDDDACDRRAANSASSRRHERTSAMCRGIDGEEC
jgi:hypothetical protein